VLKFYLTLVTSKKKIYLQSNIGAIVFRISTPLFFPSRFVGPYVDLCRDLSFVLEDSQGVCGYVLAALDSQEFYGRFKTEWLPSVLHKYPMFSSTQTDRPKLLLLGPEEVRLSPWWEGWAGLRGRKTGS